MACDTMLQHYGLSSYTSALNPKFNSKLNAYNRFTQTASNNVRHFNATQDTVQFGQIRESIISPTLRKIPTFFTVNFKNMVADINQSEGRNDALKYNFTIGAPTTEPPEAFKISKISYMTQEGTHLYSPPAGISQFNNAVEDYLSRRFGIDSKLFAPTDPKLKVMPLQGSNQGLIFLLQSVLRKTKTKNTIAMPALSYPSFVNGAILGGFNCQFIPSQPNSNIPDYLGYFKEHPDKIKNTRAIIINFPSNPTGSYPDKDSLEELVKFAKTHNILIISDAAYAENYLPENRSNNQPASIFEIKDAEDIAVEFHSLSKTFNLTGDRVAFTVGNPVVIDAMVKYKGILDAANVPIYTQLAAADLLNNDPVTNFFIGSRHQDYREKYKAFNKGLKELGWNKGFTDLPEPNGHHIPFYLWRPVPTDYTPSTEAGHFPEHLNLNTLSEKFVYDLVKETGVGMIPGSAFGKAGDNYVRIALTQPVEVINEAIEALKKSSFNYNKL